VTITAITDDNPLSAGCLALVGTSIPAGGSVSCTYDVTHTEAGTYNNTASVTVRDNEGNTASASDDETVAVTMAAGVPEIDIEKYVSVDGGVNWLDADTPPYPEVMTTYGVMFKYVVTNTGNVTLTGLTLTDNVYDGSSTPPFNPTIPGSLAPGESFEYIYGPVAAQYDQHTNTGTATGNWTDTTVTDSDSANYMGKYWAFTPGFWKTHTTDKGKGNRNAWPYTAYETTDLLGNVFDATLLNAYTLKGKTLDQYTLLQALNFQGGNTIVGALQILLRSATASLLNASFHEVMHEDCIGENGHFPYSSAEIIQMVNAAISSGNRETIIGLYEELDVINNGIHEINWESMFSMMLAQAQVPAVTSVAPASGNRNQTLDVTITGTNLSGATTVSFGSGISINSITVDNSTQVTVNISISATAKTSPRDVSVTTSKGTATLAGAFTVVR